MTAHMKQFFTQVAALPLACETPDRAIVDARQVLDAVISEARALMGDAALSARVYQSSDTGLFIACVVRRMKPGDVISLGAGSGGASEFVVRRIK